MTTYLKRTNCCPKSEILTAQATVQVSRQHCPVLASHLLERLCGLFFSDTVSAEFEVGSAVQTFWNLKQRLENDRRSADTDILTIISTWHLLAHCMEKCKIGTTVQTDLYHSFHHSDQMQVFILLNNLMYILKRNKTRRHYWQVKTGQTGYATEMADCLVNPY